MQCIWIICVYVLCVSSVAYLLILNLLQLSHRTSHASVCAKIIRLEHFNRAQNIFARKVFMLYLAMKPPEYDQPSLC